MANQTARRPKRFAAPVALTIAGSDSSAGAGVQADLKTFAALGVYGLSAITCVVAETPGKVSRIEPVSAAMIREQIEVVAKGFPIAAIKTGLLCTRDIVSGVAAVIARLRRKSKVAVVVDPVMISTSGDRMLERKAIAVYEKNLFPIATLITPNLDEASVLLGREIADRKAMEAAVRALCRKYGTNVLLKGGHLGGRNALDLLCVDGRITEFSAAFVRGVATHGTGCTYSAAITAGLARGSSLKGAIKEAKQFVTSAIRQHLRWGNIHALNHSLPPRRCNRRHPV